MASEDDILSAPVPDPDAEPTAAERAHARAFAELLDKTMAGGALPPAMSADDRALLEMATVIRSSTGGLELSPSKLHSIVEQGLRQATDLGATPITGARRKRLLPWVVASASTLVAVAALLLLWLRTPTRPARTDVASVPTSWKSRSADALIGRIPRSAAGDASARIDHIFADRLEGFRDRRMSATGKRGGKP
ncbi:MAG: hypothetical protein H6Q90_1901 [Deltaproteobacteria bacterium]|nr:hypothetical protein [Deltaproteobacteria bacterium]